MDTCFILNIYVWHKLYWWFSQKKGITTQAWFLSNEQKQVSTVIEQLRKICSQFNKRKKRNPGFSVSFFVIHSNVYFCHRFLQLVFSLKCTQNAAALQHLCTQQPVINHCNFNICSSPWFYPCSLYSLWPTQIDCLKTHVRWFHFSVH